MKPYSAYLQSAQGLVAFAPEEEADLVELSAREEAGGEADSSVDQSQSSLGLTSSERALSLSQQSLHVQNTPLLLHLSPLDITTIRIQINKTKGLENRRPQIKNK